MKIFPEELSVTAKSSILLKNETKKHIYKNDCLNCLFDPMFKFAFLLNPIKGKCRHLSQNYHGNTVFVGNNKIRLVSTIYFFCCFILNLIYLREFILEAENYVVFIAGSYNIIKAESILLIVTLLLVRLPIRENYLMKLSHLFENKKYYGVNYMISESSAKKIMKEIHFAIISTIVVFLSYPILYYIQFGPDAFKYVNIIFFFTASIQSSLVFVSCTQFYLFKLIYGSVHTSLTTHLEKCRKSVYSDISTLSLEERLRRTSHLYIELRNCLDIVIEYEGPIYIFSMTTINFLIILNIYTMFLVLTNDSGGSIWLTQMNTLGQIFVLVNLIKAAHGVPDQVRQIFLHKRDKFFLDFRILATLLDELERIIMK